MNVMPAPSPKGEPPDGRPADPSTGPSGDASRSGAGIDGGAGDDVLTGTSADVPADKPADGSDTGSDTGSEGGKGTGFMAVLQSVAAAGIGVQSSRNRKRDFEHGKPVHFIIGGLIGTALLLLAVWLFVRVLLATAPG